MMIHEYHKIVGKNEDKTRIKTQKQKQSRFAYFYLAVDSLKVTILRINHNFPIFSYFSVTTVVQLQILEVS